MARGDLIPKSFLQFPSVFSSLQNIPTSWDEITQWMGTSRGVTISEDDQHLYIEADLPGLKNEDVNVSLHQNTLIIQGEKKEKEDDKEKRFHRRAQRSYYYEVQLPSTVQENTEQADFHGGVLKLIFNKSTQSDVKKIHIRGDSQRQDKSEQKNEKKNNKK